VPAQPVGREALVERTQANAMAEGVDLVSIVAHCVQFTPLIYPVSHHVDSAYPAYARDAPESEPKAKANKKGTAFLKYFI
jgi:hypothetical protein